MKVAIATVQVPFISGGAEIMTNGLCRALQEAGHQVEIISIPFRFSPPTIVSAVMDVWQKQEFDHFDCGPIDHVIALKFPAYYLNHPKKTVWLMHQHRSVYELFDTPYGESSENVEATALRDKIIKLDSSAMSDSRAVFTISHTVSKRLKKYNNIESKPLYQPPPYADDFQPGPTFPYIFCPSRLESLKRQDLLIRAMEKVDEPVIAIIAGEGGQQQNFVNLVNYLGLEHRVKFTGRIDDETMHRYYSKALGVFFGPYAEDYGFVTLEAMLSSKPVITCTDSGGPTELVIDGETGYIVMPEADMVAEAINQLWTDRNRAKSMGENGREHYRALNISWSNVVETLLGESQV